MELFGIGAWELIIIVVIALIVLGPKQLVRWSYKLGQYVAILRKMWGETAQTLQREFDDAGVDIKVPRDIPTKQNIQKEITRAMTPITKPLKDSVNELSKDINNVKEATSMGTWTAPTIGGKPIKPIVPVVKPKADTVIEPPSPPPATPTNGTGEFGTWSQGSGDRH